MLERLNRLDYRPGGNPTGDADDQGVEVMTLERGDGVSRQFAVWVVADNRRLQHVDAVLAQGVGGLVAAAGEEFHWRVDFAEADHGGSDWEECRAHVVSLCER